MHWIHLIPIAHAAGGFGLDQAVSGTGIPSGTTIPGLIANVLKVALGFVATLFLLLMVYAGFLYMTARGDEKKVSSAKQMIVGAIVGVLIIASAYAVTSFVLNAVTGQATSAPGTGGSQTQKLPEGAACQGTAEGNDSCASGICAGKATGKCSNDNSDCADDTDCSGGGTCSGGGGYHCLAP